MTFHNFIFTFLLRNYYKMLKFNFCTRTFLRTKVIFLRIHHRYFRIAFLSDDMVLNNFTLYILSSKE